MIGGTEPRWYSGQEICNFGVKGFELFKAVKDGKLTPHDEATGMRVVNYDTLPLKKWTQKEIENQIRTIKRDPKPHQHFEARYPYQGSVGARHPQSPIGVRYPYQGSILTELKELPEDRIKDAARWIYEKQVGEPIIPPDCMGGDFTVESVKKYIYEAEEVLSILKEFNIIAPPKEIQSIPASQKQRPSQGDKEGRVDEEANEIKDLTGDVESQEVNKGLTPQEIKPQKQPPQTANEIRDYESSVRSLQVSYVSDTEIRIREGGKRAKTYGMKELGFKKESPNTWKALIKILNSQEHFFCVGKAHGANRERKKSYDSARKVLVEINKKLVSFFNETYQLQLPERYKVYELAREEQPGTYRFTFEIKRHSDADIEGFKKLSKDLLSQIEVLSEQKRILSKRGDEEAETQKYKIEDQLNAAVAIACESGWLGPNRARSYLTTDHLPPVGNPIEDEYLIQED
jgi:hypothetical protein